MPDRGSDEDLAKLVAELVSTLRELEAEVEPPRDRGLRPPTPRELRRFASEVAIPAIILVLETNIRALRLLQRAFQVTEQGERTSESVSDVRDRAVAVSETTLDRLDDALVDLQGALEGRPDNEEAAQLLADARRLREEVRDRLAAATEGSDSTGSPDAGTGADDSSDGADDGSDGASADSDDATDADRSETVSVDVDAELASIKRELDDGDADDADDADDAAEDEPPDASDGGSASTDDSDTSSGDDADDAADT